MDKIWYILVQGKEKGPFAQTELLLQSGFTPDTLTRKTGSKEWLPARKIPELQSLFEEEQPEETSPSTKIKSPRLGEGDSLVISADPPFFSFWLMLIIGILLIIFYMLTKNL